MTIHIPQLIAHIGATITWSVEPRATYVLERQVNADGFFELYEGPDTSYLDTPPAGTIVYRVKAVYPLYTFDEIEADFANWDELDSYGFVPQESDWATSDPQGVQPMAIIYYILRDGTPVARLDAPDRWMDYTAIGTHTYMVRAVDEDDNFTDSNPVTLTIEVEYATVAPMQNPANMAVLKLRRSQPPSVNQSYSVVASAQHFDGRVYPVYTDSKNRDSIWTLEFTHRTIAECERLMEIVRSGRPIVYRDLYGNRLIGFANTISQDFLRRWRGRSAQNAAIDFAMSLRAIDCREVVDYD